MISICNVEKLDDILYRQRGMVPPHRDLQTRFLNFEDPHGGMVATSKVPGCGRKPKKHCPSLRNFTRLAPYLLAIKPGVTWI